MDYTNGNEALAEASPMTDDVDVHLATIAASAPTPPEAPPALTLAALDAQIAATQTVVTQLLGALTATETYQAYTRMCGGLDALKAMRVLLTGDPP